MKSDPYGESICLWCERLQHLIFHLKHNLECVGFWRIFGPNGKKKSPNKSLSASNLTPVKVSTVEKGRLIEGQIAVALLEAIINRQVDCCDHTTKLAADTWQTCCYQMYLQCAEASRINGAYYLNGRGGVVPWLLFARWKQNMARWYGILPLSSSLAPFCERWKFSGIRVVSDAL